MVERWVSRMTDGDAAAVGYCSGAVDGAVDGKTLLAYASLARDDVRADFGLTVGKANSLWAAICELAELSDVIEEGVPPQAAARAAAREAAKNSPRGGGDTSPRGRSPTNRATSERETALRSELAELTLTPLKKFARLNGVTEVSLESVDYAEDADEVKASVVELIVAADEDQWAIPARNLPGREALRFDLERMTPAVLKKRALAGGITRHELERIRNRDIGIQTVADYKGAVIDLILNSESASASDEALLRFELVNLSQAALTRRAAAQGVSEAELKEVAGADGFIGTVVELIVAKVAADDRLAVEAEERAELMELSQVALLKRAAGAGVTDGQLEDAETQEDYKGVVADLVMAATAAARAAAGGSPRKRKPLAPAAAAGAGAAAAAAAAEAEKAALLEELSGMKLMALINVARGKGVSDEQLEAAEDEDDYKQALVGLIVRVEQASSQSAEEIRVEQAPTPLRLTAAMVAAEKAEQERQSAAPAVAARPEPEPELSLTPVVPLELKSQPEPAPRKGRNATVDASWLGGQIQPDRLSEMPLAPTAELLEEWKPPPERDGVYQAAEGRQGKLRQATVDASWLGGQVAADAQLDAQVAKQPEPESEPEPEPPVLLPVLKGGGEAAAAAVKGVLEHALDLMDVKIVNTPRRERGKIAERLEDLEEKVESSLVPALSALQAGELVGVAGMLGTVQGIHEADLTDGGPGAAGDKLRLIVELLGALEQL